MALLLNDMIGDVFGIQSEYRIVTKSRISMKK